MRMDREPVVEAVATVVLDGKVVEVDSSTREVKVVGSV